ncbi:hypothetical protein KSD_01110 [Ktedonobacter sp. SOSP1-85]|nr:hypothetical protein KSD_01110 [Ktedonobacter sp. SOSP1-85]
MSYLRQPGIKLASLASAQHERKLLDELIGQSHFFMDLTDLLKTLSLLLSQLI